MLTRLLNYYNEQYIEDKVIFWIFMTLEAVAVFMALIMYIIYMTILEIISMQ